MSTVTPSHDLPMTQQVLSDCKVALAELRKNPQGQQWRIQWVGTLALLRTIANTFDFYKTNPAVHPDLQMELQDFYDRMAAGKSTKTPPIYWSFIRDDTNDLLHYWKFSAAHHVTMQRDDDEMIMTTEKWSAEPTRVHSVDTSGEHKGFTPGSTYLMKSGPFANQDQRDVVQQAIDWYEDEIAGMIRRAKAKP
jgi:hypothetical protein